MSLWTFYYFLIIFVVLLCAFFILLFSCMLIIFYRVFGFLCLYSCISLTDFWLPYTFCPHYAYSSLFEVNGGLSMNISKITIIFYNLQGYIFVIHFYFVLMCVCIPWFIVIIHDLPIFLPFTFCGSFIVGCFTAFAIYFLSVGYFSIFLFIILIFST